MAEWITSWLLVLNGLVVPVLVYLSHLQRSIRDELRTLNGRLLKMETWRAGHEKQDDERHEALMDRTHPRR